MGKIAFDFLVFIRIKYKVDFVNPIGQMTRYREECEKSENV